jgi:GAF domain-containing protein
MRPYESEGIVDLESAVRESVLLNSARSAGSNTPALHVLSGVRRRAARNGSGAVPEAEAQTFDVLMRARELHAGEGDVEPPEGAYYSQNGAGAGGGGAAAGFGGILPVQPRPKLRMGNRRFGRLDLWLEEKLGGRSGGDGSGAGAGSGSSGGGSSGRMSMVAAAAAVGGRPASGASGASSQARVEQLERENDALISQLAQMGEAHKKMLAQIQGDEDVAAIKERARRLELDLRACREENEELKSRLELTGDAGLSSASEPITQSSEQLGLLRQMLTEQINGREFMERLDAVPNQVKKDWILTMSLQLRTLGKLLSLTEAINQNMTTMQTAMQKITSEACKVLGAERATVFAVDPKRRELYSLVVSGNGSPLVIRIPDDVGIAGHTYQTNELTNIPDAYEDPRFNREVDRRSGLRTKAILCAPIWAHAGLKVGLIQVCNKIGGGEFTEEDENAIQVLSLKVGIHLYHSAVFEDGVEFMRSQPVLKEIMSIFLSEINLGLEMDLIVEEVCEKVDCERGSVFLADFKTQELFSVSSKNAKEIRIPWSTGIVGACFGSGSIINIPDAYADPRFNQGVDKITGFRTRSIICLPIRSAEDRIIGVIQGVNHHNGPFDNEAEFYAKRIAGQAAFSLQYAYYFSGFAKDR